MTQESLKKKLAEAVVSFQRTEVQKAAEEALAAGMHPFDIIKGLSEGMREIGRLWNAMEIFLPEVMAAADAYYAGLNLVKPRIAVGESGDYLATIIFGTIYGDIHSVGKDVAIPVFQAENFNVVDLGVDVSPQQYIDAVKEHKAQIVGLGTYMSETFMHVGEVVKAFAEAGIRDNILVICGGPATDPLAAQRMGADDAFNDAWVAVARTKELIKGRGVIP
jgi:5-methyltetrahydrofolate--homocysteine methyltransferase